MNSWTDRLAKKLKDLGWSAVELSRRSGIPEKRIYKYLQNGVENPRGNTLAIIAQHIGVTEQWLRYGVEENMQHNVSSSIFFDKLSNAQVPVVDYHELIMLIQGSLEYKKLMPRANTILVSPDNRLSGEIIAYTVLDDSNSPFINRSDIVTIDLKKPPQLGRRVLAVLENYSDPIIGVYRRSHRKGHPVNIIHFENENYEDIILDDAKVNAIFKIVSITRFEED